MALDLLNYFLENEISLNRKRRIFSGSNFLHFANHHIGVDLMNSSAVCLAILLFVVFVFVQNPKFRVSFLNNLIEAEADLKDFNRERELRRQYE